MNFRTFIHRSCSSISSSSSSGRIAPSKVFMFLVAIEAPKPAPKPVVDATVENTGSVVVCFLLKYNYMFLEDVIVMLCKGEVEAAIPRGAYSGSIDRFS